MELTAFHYVIGTLALIMLIWNTVEVGRNDAANIVNAVFGARVMTRRKAVWLAGIAVVVGAMASLSMLYGIDIVGAPNMYLHSVEGCCPERGHAVRGPW